MVAATAGLLLTAATFVPAQAQEAAPAASVTIQKSGLWDNCTNFNKTYHHGVGRKFAHDRTSGTPVRTFLRSNAKYHNAMVHNSDLDRDRDHVACEKA
jgi:hypothetical protein